MKLIIGLGNPGREYEGTRHNIGFEAVDRLADLHEGTWSSDEDRMSRVAKISVGGETVLLAEPQTFMNKSGDAALAFSQYYKLAPTDILVIHDDMDLEPGQMKFTDRAGAAGHNGVLDIHEKLKTDAISRIRVGVGRPDGELSAETWVLTQPDDFDAEQIEDATQRAVTEALAWLER